MLNIPDVFLVNVTLAEILAAVEDRQFNAAVFLKIKTETLLKRVFNERAEIRGVFFNFNRFGFHLSPRKMTNKILNRYFLKTVRLQPIVDGNEGANFKKKT
jgi:hypothetical protein